jgi:hypothetical protein
MEVPKVDTTPGMLISDSVVDFAKEIDKYLNSYEDRIATLESKLEEVLAKFAN